MQPERRGWRPGLVAGGSKALGSTLSVCFAILATLPAAGIALTVEAGNEQNPVGFNLIKQAIGKARHRGASAAFMNGRKPQGRFCDELDGVFDRQDKAL